MLELRKEGAVYSETDLPLFNPEGAQRVRTAIEMAQQARALATSNDELRAATARLQAAGELSRSEHRLAEAKFGVARDKCCEVIRALQKQIISAVLPNLDRMQFTNRLEGCISNFYRKDFVRAERAALGALQSLNKQLTAAPPKPFAPSPAAAGKAPSTTALFHKGSVLESKGRTREAVECYAQVVERNPNHWLALSRLRSLSASAPKGGF